MLAPTPAAMSILPATRLTREAARRLREAPGPGRVHSAFGRTVNVELAGLGDAGWLSLHGVGPIPAPFGIACARLEATPDLAGLPARVDGDALVLGKRLRVDFGRAVSVNTELPAVAPMPPVARCLVPRLRSASDSLLPVAACLLNGAPAPRGMVARLAAPTLLDLAVATRARDIGGVARAARRLLGLGPGLTPAGDDCLVGWLVAAWVAGPSGQELAETVGPRLLAAASSRTGALSRAFLAAVVARQTAEPVRRFVTSPDAEGLAVLLALGATSGADLLAGYLLGRAALASFPAEAEAIG